MGLTYVYNSGTSEPVLGELDVTFGMFFDGTGNNRMNTEIRKKVQGVEGYNNASTAQQKTYKKEALNNAFISLFTDKEKDNSYKNDFSNVARMSLCVEQNYGIYTEGIGTENEERDKLLGKGFGTGSSGIIEKVRKGCESLATETIKELKSKRKINIISVEVDAFGFSRGAAAARNFVYEIQKAPYPPKSNVSPGPHGHSYLTDHNGYIVTQADLIESKLPPFGHFGLMLKRMGVKEELIHSLRLYVRFVGLYDTVASYGIIHRNDIKQLNLNSLGNPAKVVHFTAMNEFRKNFPLTHIPFGIEKAFPGVHSDIGGGYDNEINQKTGSSNKDGIVGSEENRTLAYGNSIQETFSKSLQNLKNKLVNEGWYREKDLKIENFPPFTVSKRLIGNRGNLRKEYSYLILHYMEFYASEKLIKGEFVQSTKMKYPIDGHPVLIDADKILREFVEKDTREWILMGDNSTEDETLKDLRYLYIHRSTNAGDFVNSPTSDGKRTKFS